VGTKAPGKGTAEQLRRKAEARLSRAATPPTASPAGLLHELQVHQVELELQNEELRRTQVELELAHARYVELYDFAPVGYFTVDGHGDLTSINLAGAAMLGYQRAWLLGRPFSRFVAAQDLPRWERQQKQSRLTGGARSCELQLQPEGGRPFPAQLICGAGDERMGEAGGSKWALLDISERRAAEEEREQRVEDLLQLNEQLGKARVQLMQADKLAAIGQLAAGVAHEVNNPLTYVKSNACMFEERAGEVLTALEETWKAEEACSLDCVPSRQLRRLREGFDLQGARRDLKEMMAESMEGLDRVAALMRDLKDFAHPDQGAVEEVELHEVIERALRVIEGTVAGGAHLVRDWGQGVPKLRCRPSQLDQVFMNLLLNAIQAGRPGMTVTLRTGRAGEEVWAEIEDDGPGIADGNLDRVFEPFFTTKRIGEGTGLGLSVAYGIVRGHGGRIELKSRVGAGSTFRVLLPIAGPPEVAAPPPIPFGAGRYQS
jgi:PAS domain S-box-containing protein